MPHFQLFSGARRLRKHFRLGILLLACFCHQPVSAQEALNQTLPGYSQRLYGIANGLPEQTVQAITQTPDRYLWIGTTGGLVRFDGSHFTVFDRNNTPALQANSIFALLAARDGGLWIGTEGSGLIEYRHGTFRTYGQAEGLTDLFVRTLAQDSEGNVWVGTNNGIFRVAQTPSGTRLQRLDGTPGFPSMAVNAICEDARGRIWLGGSGLAVIDHGQPRFYALPGDPARNRVKAIAETSPGVLWVGTVSGLFRLTPGQDSFLRVPGIRGTARGLHKTSDGQFWVSIVGQGTIAYKLGPSHQLLDGIQVPTDAVLSLFEDAEQNLWLGSVAGLLRLSRTPLTILPIQPSGASDFGTVYQDRSGLLWMASTQLLCMRGTTVTTCPIPNLGRLRVRDVLEDRDGTFWMGTDGSGLLHIAGGKVRQYTTADGLANNFIRALLQDRDGTLWIGTDEGISHFNGLAFTSYRMRDGLAYQSIRSLLQSSDGDLWIGTELGLSHLHHGTFVFDGPVSALQHDKVWALHQDRDGALWFGTRNDGLYCLDHTRLTHYTTADGLAADSLYDIEEDPSGRFWLSGPAGISLLNRLELKRYAEDRSRPLSLSFYSVASGTEPIQIFGGMQSAGAVTANGTIWFPTNRGLLHIDPSRILQQPDSPVVFNRILVDGREVPADAHLDIRPGESRLEINYASVTLRSQDGLRFRYKLDGLDKAWVDAGKRHVAEYTNVPPGRYTFHVAAYDLSRPDHLIVASLPIVKGPHFYATWWFYVLIALALLGLAFAIYRSRMNLVRRRFRLVLAERSRLAREVHDTVLQGCAGVSTILEALSTLSDRDKPLHDTLLESAKDQMRSTINEAREAIWCLRHESEPQSDLAETVARMSARLSADLGLPIECSAEGQAFPVSRDTAHELLMVVREALHNTAHHAEANRARVQLTYAPNALLVSLEDDGRGFLPNSLPEHENHFGIVGMRERVSRLGGTFHLHSAPAQGTVIRIQLPQAALAASEAIGV